MCFPSFLWIMNFIRGKIDTKHILLELRMHLCASCAKVFRQFVAIS